MKTDVSVILTVHNDAKYLRRTLDALKNQTKKELEFICVDDASEDNSAEIIRAYAKKDPRFKLIVLKKNQGLAGARNEGLKRAKSPYLMFCDGDDFYHEQICEKLYNCIHRENVDFAVCRIRVIYEAHQEMRASDDEYYRLKFAGRQPITEDLLRNLDLSVDNKIFRKKTVEKYRLNFPFGLKYEDTFFTLAYSAVSRDAYFLDEPLYFYTRRESSIMANTWSKTAASDSSIDHIRVFEKLHIFLKKYRLLEAYKNFFWDFYALYAGSAHKWCKTEENRQKIRRSIDNYLAKNSAEIATLDPAVRNYLKYVSSPYFFSKPYRFARRARDKILALKSRFTARFCKVENSQTWALKKLSGENQKITAFRAELARLRKTL